MDIASLQPGAEYVACGMIGPDDRILHFGKISYWMKAKKQPRLRYRSNPPSNNFQLDDEEMKNSSITEKIHVTYMC